MTSNDILGGASAIWPTRSSFVTSDDVELALWDSGPTDAATTVLFAHGWTLDHRTWTDVAARLRAGRDDVRVVAYDHRGHGESQVAPAGSATITRLGQDMHEIIDVKIPSGSIILVGHSMGGMTMMELGAAAPGLVRERVAGAGFVATSAGPFFPRVRHSKAFRSLWSGALDRTETQGERTQSERSARLGARLSLFGSGAKTHDIDRAIAQSALAGAGSVKGFGLSLADHEREAALSVFRAVPSVVLGGTRDRLTPVRHSRALAENLPMSTLTVFPGAGHMLPYERTRAVSGRLRMLVDEVVATRVAA